MQRVHCFVALLLFFPRFASAQELFEIKPVADGVYAAIAKDAYKVNCNAAIILLDDGVLVVDTHSKPSAARGLIAQIRTLTDKPVKYVVNTHFHWDHYQGNQAYPSSWPSGVEIISSEATRESIELRGIPRVQRAILDVPKEIAELKSDLEKATDPKQKDQIRENLRQAEDYLAELKTMQVTLPTMTFDHTLILHRKSRTVEILWLGKARQVLELRAQVYSRDSWAHGSLVFFYGQLGQYDKALEQAREFVRLQEALPVNAGSGYDGLLISYILLNRLEEAQATVREAQAKNFDSPVLHAYLYMLAFLQNDASAMKQQVDWAAGKPEEALMLANEADTAAYSGRLREAREFSRRAMDSAERAGEKESAARCAVMSGLREALFGNAGEARRHAAMAMERSTGNGVQYGAALALAYAGDERQAQELADDLRKRFPEATIVQSDFLPTLRAKLLVDRGNAPEAIERLRAAAPYELATSATYYWVALYPIFVRGQAYLAAHQGSEAAAEFQRILDHRTIVWNSPIGALAHLQIGRAYAMQGDTVKAKAAYQDFLTLWKDADPDIPILKEAKAEYARLQ